MTKTAIIRLLADAGPNTFNTFGVGADQVSRLKDADDATGIRANATGLRSQFSIDPADIPLDVDYVTQVTVLAREQFVSVFGGVMYECYVSAALLQSQLELHDGTITISDYQHPLFTGAEQILPADLPTMEIAFYAQGIPGTPRWEIMEASVQITYVTNAADVELHTQTGEALLQTGSGAAELHAQDGNTVLDTGTGDTELHAQDGTVKLVAK